MKNDKGDNDNNIESSSNIFQHLESAKNDFAEVHRQEEANRRDISNELGQIVSDMDQSVEATSQQASMAHNIKMQKIEELERQLAEATHAQDHSRMMILIEKIASLNT